MLLKMFVEHLFPLANMLLANQIQNNELPASSAGRGLRTRAPESEGCGNQEKIQQYLNKVNKV